MLKEALTNSLPLDHQSRDPKKQAKPHYSTFFQHSPSAFAIYNGQNQELNSWNDAFLNLWQCEAFILREPFPNASLLRIQESDFVATWQQQISNLENRSQSSFECTILTKYGESKTLRIQLWKMSAKENAFVGMKIDDVTNTKKLALESRNHIRII